MNTISVGQALLILMHKYKKNQNMRYLKSLYLTGPLNKKEHKDLNQFLKDPILAEYKISKNATVINEDPTRRYFETHLAFETMRLELKHLDITDVKAQYETYYHSLSGKDRVEVDSIFAGGTYERGDDVQKEFSDAIVSIYSNPHYQAFPLEDKRKLEFLVKMGYLSLKIMHSGHDDIPLAKIYHSGYFARENRGRLEKDDQNTVSTSHFGLVKGHMALPQDDIAFRGTPFLFSKPSERNDFDLEAKWPIDNFEKLVHPFSGSISGTFLCLLRIMAWFELSDELHIRTKEQISPFINCFISVLLYNSGGHSFNEFYSVLNSRSIQEEFKFIKNFDEITLEALMLGKNEKAFDIALAETINYNNLLLAKNKLHEEIIKNKHPLKPATSRLFPLEKKKSESKPNSVSTHLPIKKRPLEATLKEDKRSGLTNTMTLFETDPIRFPRKKEAPKKQKPSNSSQCKIL